MVLLLHHPEEACSAMQEGVSTKSKLFFSFFYMTEQDSVRLLAVESCGSFARQLTPEDSSTMLLPVVQMLSQVCL